MLKHLVPTLSTFTYLRFEFLADDYLTPEERLRKSMQLASYQMLANNPKRSERVVHAASGAHLHEMITADFRRLELATHINMPREVVICEDKRPIKTMDLVLEELARSARTNDKYWAFGRQHGMGVESLTKAIRGQP